MVNADGAYCKYRGRGWHNLLCRYKAGGSRRPPSSETVANREHFVYQEGATVFKFAVTNMANVAAQVMERNHLTNEEVAWLVPLQANKRIIDSTGRRVATPPSMATRDVESSTRRFGFVDRLHVQ